MATLSAAALISLVTLGLSFGGDLRIRSDNHRRIVHTSFGGVVDVARAPLGARIRSFGGEVRFGATQGTVEVTSFGGDVEIDSLGGDARLSSYGGDVNVSLADVHARAVRRIVLRSFGGDVHLNIPRDFDATIEVHASCRPGHEDRCGVRGSDLGFRETRRTSRSLFRKREVLDARAKMGDGRHQVIVRLEEARIVIRRVGHGAGGS